MLKAWPWTRSWRWTDVISPRIECPRTRRAKDEPMFKPIPDYANEAYEVVAASYPAGWWTVTAHGIPIRHFGDKGKAERYASDPEYRASIVSRRL